MFKKSLVIATLAAAAATGTLSTSASAQGDPVLGALLGAGIGAAIGNAVHGSNGAWVGGALGAVTGASIAAGSGRYYNGSYYGPASVYDVPGYVAPAYAPAYIAPEPLFVPRPAVYVAPFAYRARPVYAQPYPVRIPAYRHFIAYGRYDGYHGAHPAPYGHGGAH